MAETVDNKKGLNTQQKQEAAPEKIQVETGAIELEEPQDFTPEEIALMTSIKQRIAAGEFNDITDEYRKLLFVQWLIDHDKISS